MRITCACLLVSVMQLYITANGASKELQKLATKPEDPMSRLLVTKRRNLAKQITSNQPEEKLARLTFLRSPPEMPTRKPAEQVATIQPEDKLARPSVLLSRPEGLSSKPIELVTTNQAEDKPVRISLLPPPEMPTSKPEEVTTSRSMPEYECERRPLTVNFADLGWGDYILAPNDYDAGYCSGECVPQSLPKTTNHAIIQTLVRRLIQDAVPAPCCVPTELESVPLLYFSEGSNSSDIELRNFPNMKVKSCGCR